jgi:hypothetical protein
VDLRKGSKDAVTKLIVALVNGHIKFMKVSQKIQYEFPHVVGAMRE